MKVRRIGPHDGRLLRDVRLRALEADPDAFGSSYGHEAPRPLEWWDTWAALSAEGADQAMYLAEDDAGAPVGLAGAFRVEQSPRTMHLIAMWVDPEHRRSGAARALTDAIVNWARRSDADEVTLWVVAGKDAARRLYETCGFALTGEAKPLPSDPNLVEHRMALQLGSRMRMPSGYVDLVPMQAADVRAFVEWVIADRTARAMEGGSLPLSEAGAMVRGRVTELLDGPPGTSHHFFNLRAGIDPDPRGWLWLSERRREGDRYAVLEELVVFEEFRGRGLAASAVEAAAESALSTGIVTMETTVPIGNHAALRVAEATGFVEVARSQAEVTMRLEIDPAAP